MRLTSHLPPPPPHPPRPSPRRWLAAPPRLIPTSPAPTRTDQLAVPFRAVLGATARNGTPHTHSGRGDEHSARTPATRPSTRPWRSHPACRKERVGDSMQAQTRHAYPSTSLAASRAPPRRATQPLVVPPSIHPPIPPRSPISRLPSPLARRRAPHAPCVARLPCCLSRSRSRTRSRTHALAAARRDDGLVGMNGWRLARSQRRPPIGSCSMHRHDTPLYAYILCCAVQ